jgi:Xaa-Pro aminopeptidase
MRNSVLPSVISKKIIIEKHLQIKEVMKSLAIECWITFVRETEVNNDPVLPFIVGNDVVWSSAFIFSLKSDVFKKIAIIGNFDADTEEKKGIWDQIIGYKEGIAHYLKEIIDNISPNQIAINFSLDDVSADGLSHGMFLKLSEMLQPYKDKFTSAEKIIQHIRSSKTKTELELIKKACLVTEEINNKMTNDVLKAGITELYIQEQFHNLMNEMEVLESWQRDSCPAVDAGPDKVFGHVGPTELEIQKGHTLHNDFGIKWQAYSSDLQRMWFFGTKAEVPQELRHAFDTVKEAIRRASKVIKPGMKGYEIDQIARNYVISQGYEGYAHALGHQVGRATHDGGVLLGPLWERYGDSPKAILAKNNVFTLELYVTTKNFGMVSLEEMIVITEHGCEFIVPPIEDFIYVNSKK